MNLHLFTQLNLAAYLLACLGGFFAWLRCSPTLLFGSRRLMELALAMHGAYIVARVSSDMDFSVSSGISMASLWLLVSLLLALVGDAIYRLGYATFLFFLLPLILKILQMDSEQAWFGAGSFADVSVLMNIHSVCSVLALAFLTSSFVAAVLFLILEFQLKRKRIGFLTKRLPSLGSLDQMGFSSTLWGFLFLTLSIVTGAVAGRSAGESAVIFGSREWLIFFTWLVYVFYFQVRVQVGQLSHRLAIMAIFSYLVQLGALFLLLGVHRF